MTGFRNAAGIVAGEMDFPSALAGEDALEQLIKGQVGYQKPPVVGLVVVKEFSSNGKSYRVGDKTTLQDENFIADIANNVLMFKQDPSQQTFAGIPPQNLSEFLTVLEPTITTTTAGSGQQKSSVTASGAASSGAVANTVFVLLWAAYGFWVYKGWARGCVPCRVAMAAAGITLTYVTYSNYKQ